MTQAEKAYFKKFSYKTSREESAIYFQLFNSIDKQIQYDEVKILKKFEGNKIVTNFSTTKNYLFKLILKSLREFHSRKEIEHILLDNIRDIQILMAKGLYQESLKRIKKSKVKAAQSQLYLRELELIALENQAHRFIVNVKPLKAYLDTKLERENYLLTAYFNEISYNNLNYDIIYHLATLGLPKKPTDFEPYFQLANTPLLIDETAPISFRAKTVFYGLNAVLKGIQGKPDLSYHYNQILARLIAANFQLSLRHPSTYIYLLNNLIINCFTLKKYEESQAYIQLLKTLPTRSYLYQTPAIEALIFDITANSELEAYILQGAFQKAIDLQPDLLKKLKKYAYQIEDFGIAHLYYLLALCHFSLGNWSKAQAFLYLIFNDYPNVRQSILIEAKVLNLLVLFELKADQLLTHYLTTTYRYFSKLKNLQTFEQIVVKYVKKAMHQPTQKEMLPTFMQLYEALEGKFDIGKVDMTHRLVLMAWLESKIYKQPFIAIFKEKAK